LVNSLTRIISAVKSPLLVGTEIVKDLSDALKEGHYAIYSVLLQTYAFLCKEGGADPISIAKTKVILEQEMIAFCLTHPLDIQRENEALQSLQTFGVVFFDQLKILYQEAQIKAIKEANKVIPKVGVKSTANETKSEPSEGTDTADGIVPLSEAKAVLLTIVESAVDIDQDAFIVIQNLKTVLQKGISDQFMKLDKMPKEFPTQATDLMQKASSAKNTILKQLANERSIGLLKTPRFFIQYEMECVTYEGETTTGARKYSIDLAPGESRQLMISTVETTSEIRKQQASMVNNKTDTSEQSFEKIVTEEAKRTDKNHAETESYHDNSVATSLGAYADVYVDVSMKVVDAGCSGGLDYSTDVTNESGGNDSIGSSLEIAKENTFRAVEKQNYVSSKKVEIMVAESTELTNEKVSQTMQKIILTNPNQFSPISIGIYEVKTMYHMLMTVVDVNLYFGNGIQWRKINPVQLDAELKEILLDSSEIKRIKGYFKSALIVMDYKNRSVSFVDPDSKFLKVNTTPYIKILEANKIPPTEEDLEWGDRMISGIVIGIRNYVTTQAGTLMVGSVGKPLADRPLCRKLEQDLEVKDCDIKSKESMIVHCNKLSNKDDPTATDSYFKLFAPNAADLVGKLHIISQYFGSQSNKSGGAESSTENDSSFQTTKKKKKGLFKSE